MQEGWRGVAQAALDDLLAIDPVEATALGEHAHDDRLPDLSEAGLADHRRILHGHLGLLDGVDDVNLDVAEQVDLEILRAQLAKRLFALDELREHTWNPLVANPGSALYLLLARDFAPLPERLTSLAGRLAAVPEALATARASLATMPAVHVETAIAQFEGTLHLLGDRGRARARGRARPAQPGRARPRRQPPRRSPSTSRGCTRPCPTPTATRASASSSTRPSSGTPWTTRARRTPSSSGPSPT